MKSKTRKEQMAKKRAAKLQRISKPGGKSKYAAKLRGGSRYWQDIAGIWQPDL